MRQRAGNCRQRSTRTQRSAAEQAVDADFQPDFRMICIDLDLFNHEPQVLAEKEKAGGDHIPAIASCISFIMPRLPRNARNPAHPSYMNVDLEVDYSE